MHLRCLPYVFSIPFLSPFRIAAAAGSNLPGIYARYLCPGCRSTVRVRIYEKNLDFNFQKNWNPKQNVVWAFYYWFDVEKKVFGSLLNLA